MKKGSASKIASGGVLVGPKLVGDGYYRIVSHRGRYRVQRFDSGSCSWSSAPKSVTFNDVCNAPGASQWLWDLLRKAAPLKDPDAPAL
jgi:hypothetical protein